MRLPHRKFKLNGLDSLFKEVRGFQGTQNGRLIFIHLQCWEVLPFCRFQRQRCIKILCPKDPENGKRAAPPSTGGVKKIKLGSLLGGLAAQIGG